MNIDNSKKLVKLLDTGQKNETLAIVVIEIGRKIKKKNEIKGINSRRKLRYK